MTPLVRSNIPARIALQVSSEADSNITLGEKGDKGAHQLLGHGDLLLKAGGGLLRLQCPKVELDELATALRIQEPGAAKP